jgi:hypothetical protein
MTRPVINVGILIASSPAIVLEQMCEFALRMVRDARNEIQDATGATWAFHLEEPFRISGDDPCRPSDFLDEASLRMAEGPFDIVVVVTDVGLISRRRRLVAGLASPVSRIAVLSSRKLLVTPRGQQVRTLDSSSVRWNSATLLLHLLGHILGLAHTYEGKDAMAPFAFHEDRRCPARFGAGSRRQLAQRAGQIPDREYRQGGTLGVLAFHIASAVRHPSLVLRPLLHNRAPLLPLSLPRLATAAIVPTFILVFTAEIWDVGLHLRTDVVWASTLVTILAATWYLTNVQNLFYPHEEKRVLPEYLAIVNVTIFLTMLLATIGLFLMVGLLMLIIETYVFPADLMQTWPPLEVPKIELADKFRLAMFISTIAVLTGALGGGLESRAVIRHLALFLDQT